MKLTAQRQASTDHVESTEYLQGRRQHFDLACTIADPGSTAFVRVGCWLLLFKLIVVIKLSRLSDFMMNVVT